MSGSYSSFTIVQRRLRSLKIIRDVCDNQMCSREYDVDLELQAMWVARAHGVSGGRVEEGVGEAGFICHRLAAKELSLPGKWCISSVSTGESHG
jgi:hypothetical protein